MCCTYLKFCHTDFVLSYENKTCWILNAVLHLRALHRWAWLFTASVSAIRVEFFTCYVHGVAPQQLNLVAVTLLYIAVIGFMSKKRWSDLAACSWFTDVRSTIIVVMIGKYWFLDGQEAFWKIKIENEYLNFTCLVWHYNNVFIKYMLISVTCAVQVRLESVRFDHCHM